MKPYATLPDGKQREPLKFDEMLAVLRAAEQTLNQA